MKIKIGTAFASFVLAVGSLPVSAAQSDTRFDGKWVGAEILTPVSKVSPDMQKRLPSPHQAIIVIAEGGTLVGKLDSLCYGRFKNVHRTGDTLTFGAGDCHLSVTLSKDGDTLAEKGSCNLATMWAVRMNVGSGRWPVSWLPLEISGTFRRIK